MPSISQSQLTFQSGSNPIRLDAFLPATDGKLPAVLALYGSGGGVSGMNEPATMLAAQGFAVFVLHYFDRTGTTQANDKPTIFRNFPAWGKTVWDAISHIEQHPQLDPKRIGLLGFSLGAYLALSVASVDHRVKAVVEFFGGLPKEMRFFMRRLCPVLILHGEADATIPVQEAYDLQNLLEKKGIPYEIKIYPNTGHSFENDIWRDAGIRTLQFLRKYLAFTEN
ncbi:MAG: dienelactone hydrolase family protein [Acidobacteriales bacterium]|nr:dienelactone hydrolase family protein [Candidatus Koribacter versatilis]MBI3645490.1 dienelactone hydrolase family protein [Terriglobales bacterium]